MMQKGGRVRFKVLIFSLIFLIISTLSCTPTVLPSVSTSTPPQPQMLTSKTTSANAITIAVPTRTISPPVTTITPTVRTSASAIPTTTLPKTTSSTSTIPTQSATTTPAIPKTTATTSAQTTPSVSPSSPPVVTSTAPTTTTSVPPTVGEATVVRVIDGDTIEVSIAGKPYRVRYIGIDTPETVDLDKPVEPYGPEASAKNKELVEGKVVRLEKDVSEVEKIESHRLLRYVYVGNLFVNAELVRLGYARATPYEPDIKYQSLFANLEQEAKTAKRGLWGIPLSLQIVSVTSPVKTGASATLTAKTSPGAECTITVYYKSGASTASGLVKKSADTNSNVSWTWNTSSNTTPGSYKIVVTASLGSETKSQEIYFSVQ